MKKVFHTVMVSIAWVVAIGLYAQSNSIQDANSTPFSAVRSSPTNYSLVGHHHVR